MATQGDTQPANAEQSDDINKKGLSDKDLVALVKRRFAYMEEGDHDQRLRAMEDLKFTNEPGYQWDENMREERGKRPSYEYNKLRITCKRVINDIRANRPQGKVRAVEGGDKAIADIYEGLIRNIWNVSDGDSAIDYAAEYQVPAGMGAWRVDTEYSSDDGFNQDIVIRPLQNPFCLYADPSCKDMQKRDAQDWILTEKIPYKLYEKLYPDAEKVSFDDIAEFDDDDEWQDEESVRVAEYWYKKPVTIDLFLMDDGTVVDSTTDEARGILADPDFKDRIVDTREVMRDEIWSVICSGNAVLEGPTKWAGNKFPFVMVFGEFQVIDGAKEWWGLTRFAKDAQRSYNFARTAIAETIAQAPKFKWWATAKQAKGLTNTWAEAHKKNFPFMVYNPDDKAPGAPQSMHGAEIPAALIQESQIATQEIKEVTGIFDASLGDRGNETSGRAIYARQQQGEIATFNYQDNIAKGIKLTHEILIDLIPNIYDTARELRVLGSDGAEDYVRVNEVVTDPKTGKEVRVNDLATGKYDVTITIGPNFSTRRQEAAETYGQLAQQYPELMGVAGDLVMKSMDLPYADDIAERIQSMLPPGIQEIINRDKEVPPEVAQMMREAEKAMETVQQYEQMVHAAAQELQEEKAASEADKAQVREQIANLKAAKQEFEKEVAQSLADIKMARADLKVAEANLKTGEAALSNEQAEFKVAAFEGRSDAKEMVERLDANVADFIAAADDAFSRITAKGEEMDARTSRKPISGGVRREGGRLVADVEFDDGTVKSLSAIRENGALKLVPSADSEPESEAENSPGGATTKG